MRTEVRRLKRLIKDWWILFTRNNDKVNLKRLKNHAPNMMLSLIDLLFLVVFIAV